MNDTTKNAIETAAYGARVNANHASTLAASAKKHAEADQPWTAQSNLDEAEKYQAIAEAYATVAGDEATRLQTIGTRSILRAAQEATKAAKERYLEKQKTEAIHDLLKEITKNMG